MTNQKITNRTRHFLCKWHWFWSLVKENVISIFKIDTKEHIGDAFTKSGPKEVFEYLRKKYLGW